jgi:hypothetical protein
VTFTGEPLMAVAAALEISREQLVDNERADVLTASAQTRSAQVLRLGLAELQALCDAYGDAITLEVLTGEIPELTVTNGSVASSELDRLHGVAQRGDDIFGVHLRVDKAALCRHLGLDAVASLVRIYFFSEALDRDLSHPPSVVEQRLWTGPERHLVVAVADEDIRLDRPAVTVIGGRHLSEIGQVIDERPGPTADMVRIAERRDDYIGWDSALTTRLTPLHFAAAEALAAVPGQLRARLDGLALGLSAMYVCDRARQPLRAGPRTTQLEFRGREHIAYVPLDWADVAAIAERPGPAAVEAAVNLVAWCYQVIPERPESDMLADRLPFVQARVAQLLENRPETDRLDGLAEAMPSLLENAKWHWQSFIEGRINQYMEHVAGLESSVGETVDKLAERTSTLTGKLTETALGAVATLVGAFIAAAFRVPFQVRLFEVSMLAYAAYVLAFPFGIGVSSAYGAARQAVNGFGPKKRNIGEVLGSQRVDALVGNRVDAAWDRFIFWACVSGVVYSLAAAAGTVAAFLVPRLIK